MGRVTTSDFIDRVATLKGVKKEEAKSMVDAVFESVLGIVHGGDSVVIQGFGTFTMKFMPEREVRNPRTGEMVISAPKKRLLFKMARGIQ